MTDKQKHFLVGGSIGLLTLPLSFLICFGWAVFFTFIAGTNIFLAKEIWDMYKPRPTGFNKMDLAADYFGLFAGYFLALIIWLIIQFWQL